MHTLCKHIADLLHTNSKPSTRAPARSKVVETLDHGAVAVHPNRPSIAVLLVQLHPDTEEESTTRPYQQSSSVVSNSARVPSKNGGGGMKRTKSIRTCSWLIRADIEKTVCKHIGTMGGHVMHTMICTLYAHYVQTKCRLNAHTIQTKCRLNAYILPAYE